MPYTITEPHPTVPANAFTHSGRGGLGNTFRAPTSVTPAAGVPTPLARVSSASSSAHASTRFYAGRGGAGNAHPVSERRSLSLDDEYAHASAVARAAAAGHVGRGGAGNFFSAPAKRAAAPTAASAGPCRSTADRLAHGIRLGVHGHHHHHGSSGSSSSRKGSDASSVSGASVSSDEGARRSGFWGRMHR